MNRIWRALRAISPVCVATACFHLPAAAQAPALPLTGAVVDHTGAGIPHANVRLHSDSADRDAVADAAGRFTLSAPAGTYLLTIEAPGFADYSQSSFIVSANAPAAPLKIKLDIATAVQELTVGDAAGTSTDAASNGDALVFSGKTLDTLSNDPNTMNQQLLALAGGDPGNPPQLYVDGFSNGTMPPKESIREIRINQNPFSAQYDQPGYGRIEILTKPGTGKLHGEVDLNVGNSALNARNPYTTGPQPGYSSNYLNANLNGPINKVSSFFLGASRSVQASNAIINAVTLDNTTLLPTTISEAVSNPFTSQSYSARYDHQFGTTDTLIAKYIYNGADQINGGIGQLVLPAQGYSSTTHTQTLQLTDTHLFGTHVVLDAGLQYIRTHLRQDANSNAPSLIVQGSFADGGNYAQSLHDNSDRLELQQYLSISHGKHFIRTGLRYRLLREANLSSAGYNGQFVFPSLAAYQTARNTGIGATQYTVVTGQPTARLITGDLGVYAEDEWKATSRLTLNYGFRIESQSAVPDRFDFAPRVGGAYQVMLNKKAKSPFVVVRGGFGFFYTRFPSANILQSLRQNGVSQQTFIVTNPTYPSASTTLTAVPSTVYEVNPNLHSPYAMFGSVTVERALGKYGNFSVNSYFRRTVHGFESLNINAPLPGTYNLNVPTSGVRPFGGSQNIYEYSSNGVGFARNINANLNLHAGDKFGAWVYGRLGHTNTDAPSGVNGFASNSYNIGQDNGPPTGFIPRQLNGGVYSSPGWGLSFNLFVAFWSHSNFNITTGQDNNGDTIYNDRPSFATDLTRPSVVKTAYGNFDTLPIAGQTMIPSNYGTAPGFAYTEFYLNKSFHFGPRPAAPTPATAAKPGDKPAPKPDPRYEITFGIGADNVLNHTNPGTPVGVLTSPFFGQSISLNTPFNNGSAANRQVLLRTSFSF